MSAALKTLADEMHQFIDESRNKLLTGEEVDLQGLDAKVKEFCQVVGTLPADEARNWQQPLTELQVKVSDLGQLLIEQREAIVKALGAVETRKQAHRAYKTSGAAATPAKPENNNEEE